VRAALLLAALLAFAPSPAPAGAYKVTDCLGRTLTFRVIPERVVLAGRATLLIVDAVYLFADARSRVVGVGVTDQGLGDFFPFLDGQAGTKARFDNSAGPEQLAGLRPDLVILKSFMRERLGASLESLGIPVLYVDLESPEAFAADVRMLGDLFRDPARAAFVNGFYETRVAAIRRRVQGARPPATLVVQYSERDGAAAFGVPPAAWIQTRMVEIAGGSPVWKAAGVGSGWNKVGAEQAAAWKPEHLLVVSYARPGLQVVEELRGSGRWSAGLSAFPADFHSWDQADSRWILGLSWVAKRLHPDLFADLDLRAEVRAFYGELYGIDTATIESAIFPRIEGALAQR
jgi:iron complex transport system substrate-binding protein